MTRLILVPSLLFLLALGVPTHAHAQRVSAVRLFADAEAKEAATRKALTAPNASLTVLRAVRTVVADYENLVKRFPTNGYCDDALWKAAQISRDAFERFGQDPERTTAIRLLQQLAAKFPESRWATQTPMVLNTLRAATGQTTPLPVAEPPSPAAPAVVRTTPSTRTTPRGRTPAGSTVPTTTSGRRADAATAASGVATISEIRRAPLTDAVRIVIQLDREVSFHDERIANPDRIFLDLPLTQASVALLDQTLRFDGDADLIRQVRLGRHPNTTTRVVLEAAGVSSYSVYPLYNPFRLIIDCMREQPLPAATTVTTAARPPAVPVAPALPLVAPPPTAPLTPSYVDALPAVAPAVPPPVVVPPPALRSRRVDPAGEAPPVSTPSATAMLAEARLPDPPFEPVFPVVVPVVALPLAKTPAAILVPARPRPVPAEAAAQVNAPVLATTLPREPAHNLDGGFSIARQLGLGVSRIVIDPGHGGRDPGSKTSGTSEAEIVLDIAMRLEKLIAARLPGVAVSLTRRTDDYVSLQERTAIANRESADLFLSIHVNANASKDARGVETYFLNFANNLSAASVAARENAASGQLMGELPDVVRTIALNNKLDESRDFATYVQREMMSKLRGSNKGIKDLGVKQAPFVVLIGAAMPSVLAEVAFLTNPQEARLLKSGGYRQTIAEALFEGVRRYQGSLKNVSTVATQ